MKRDPSMLSALLATIANHAQPTKAIADKRRLDAHNVSSALVAEIDGSVSVCVLAWDAEMALSVLGVTCEEAVSA
jgi:hypothetical protein